MLRPRPVRPSQVSHGDARSLFRGASTRAAHLPMMAAGLAMLLGIVSTPGCVSDCASDCDGKPIGDGGADATGQGGSTSQGRGGSGGTYAGQSSGGQASTNT